MNPFFSFQVHDSSTKPQPPCGFALVKFICKQVPPWKSLVVQWLGRGAFTALDPGSIPGQGTKILQGAQQGQKKKEVPLEQAVFTGEVVIPEQGLWSIHLG